MQDNSNSVRNLVIGMLLVAAPFAIAYLLTRNNPNSEVLLIVAVFTAGLALTFAAASGLQRVGGVALRLSGRSSRDIMIVGLAALSLLTPWTIEVAVGHLPRVFGWTNPLAWVVALCLVLSVMQSARPYHGLALAGTGAALVAWVAWAGWLLSTPSFSKLQFTFMPVDLISTGWYAGLIAWVVAVDGFAFRRAREPERAKAREVWRLAPVPGMGLVRLGFAGRGRVWLATAVLAVAFVGIAAVNDSEFAYWAHYDTTPPDRGRLDVILAAAALGLVLIGSWFDTWRTLRRRAIMSDWLTRVSAPSRGETR
ncbi:MAG: hypothetical protein M3Z28_14250 [Candidatus Dormibacteraeota bacterium]|nr:hypothetical protein [Candidatus Dormibacteraeota bacterium]